MKIQLISAKTEARCLAIYKSKISRLRRLRNYNKVQNGSRQFTTVKKGSRRFKKVQDGQRRSKKVQKGPKRSKTSKIQEDSKRLKNGQYY